MPRNVRNFWVDGRVDGRTTRIGTGPPRRDGGMHLVIRQRNKGEIVTALEVECIALSDGRLRLVAYQPGCETKRPDLVVETTR